MYFVKSQQVPLLQQCQFLYHLDEIDILYIVNYLKVGHW